MQRAIRDEGIEQPGDLQELDEERHLTERRQSAGAVPFDRHRAAKRVERRPSRIGAGTNHRLITRRVSGRQRGSVDHVPEFARFSPPRPSPNCVY